MTYYAGIDLHSNNSYVAIINDEKHVVYKKRLANDPEVIHQALLPYHDELQGVVVESTYNWYWLVDALQEKRYRVHLANTTAIQVYSGLKHTDDKTDAMWLATLLMLDQLPTGHIYPREARGLRELLRKRMRLVQQQTRFILSIQSTLSRYHNITLSGDKVKQATAKQDLVLTHITDDSVRLILQGELSLLAAIMEQIDTLEKAILSQIKKSSAFKRLLKVPGIGEVLAMTILLETGAIERFKQVGNYSSYCRCVGSVRLSNNKKKGVNNRKNGNAYLAWAFIEAANYATWHYPLIKRYYQRKLAKTNKPVALKTIAHKLARAVYFVLRDQEEFDMNRLFH